MVVEIKHGRSGSTLRLKRRRGGAEVRLEDVESAVLVVMRVVVPHGECLLHGKG
jgi:hypothetical protein